MSLVVPRTCTAIPDDERDRQAESRPLDAFRGEPAYALLGDPGSGKTTAFQLECEACGADALLVPARDFLAFEPTSHREWRGKTLFIDGLDEVRAGTSDARVPLDAVRRNLDGLGRPRFRLSCREADWLGTNDRTKLDGVAPDAHLTLLRLDPLTDSDVEEILEADPRVGDPREFILEAQERGVDGFLANPQSLELLVEVVSGAGSWPASRLQLFEEACRRMARELNDEHVAASARSGGAARVATSGPVLEEVLDAAGRLCAIQLITGAGGYAQASSQEGNDLPAFDRCALQWDTALGSAERSTSRSELLRAALATKLFRGWSRGGLCPVHRHVAEFLGARYLARLIRGREPGRGLPARRVLALMTGGDGFVVTQLRGLSAWLAAQCRDARRDLVERDPIGVCLYGDVSRFSTEEKRGLLESLELQTTRLFLVSRMAAAFSPLVTPAMEPAFKDTLTDPRLQEHQSFAWFVSHILAHGSRLPGLASTLLGIVRDSTWRPDVNTAALDAFLHNHPNGQEKTDTLRALLADVQAGRVEDPDDDLLGILLTALYPGELPPSDVWEYFSLPSNRTRLGAYYYFWGRTVVRQCSDCHVAEHLDALAARLDAVGPVLRELLLEDLPVDLLVRGLEAHGDRIETRRLYDWLGVGLVSIAHEYPKAGDAPRRIRSWLEHHPESQKRVLAEGLHRAESDPRPIRLAAYDVWPRLYGSNLPADFGLWCLHEAVAASDPRIAEFLLERAVAAVIEQRGHEGLSMGVLIDHTRNDSVLADKLAELRRPDDTERPLQRHTRLARERREEDERRRGEWIAHLRSREGALRANRSSPRLLHQIAAAYFGRLREAEGKDPLVRLRSLLFDNERLVETALAALRGAIRRDDLPDVGEIISLREKSQEHYLALPFSAGLAELDRTGQDVSLHLDDRQMRIALAFRYCGVSHDEPAWYQRLLAADSDLVADVLTRCAASALRAGREYVPGLHELARSENHANVARVASLRILRSFPIRCTTEQLVDLNYLLWSALRHADRESFAQLIDPKLSRQSMNVAQRARWLAAGFVLSPEIGWEKVRAFTKHSERRIRELAAFLGDSHDAPVWIDRLGTTGLQVLVGLMGVSFGPDTSPPGEATMVTPAMEASGHLRRMIHRLAESPTRDAGAALDALASDESVVRWRDELVHARDRQRVLHRDATYRHPEVEQVCRTLNDGSSANAGDLAALVRERLNEIGVRMQTGNDNGWRLYWNEEAHRRPFEPKHEESCRDALLRDLRPHLPDEVDAQPEGRYANDTRADIRIACRDFQISVEIKRHYHRRLWSAIRDQLIAQYTTDPATGGYGIYLVLWFGEAAGRRTPPPPSGPRPDGPDALRARLEEELTPDEARRISVCVIDVSAPTSASRRLTDRTGSSESGG